MQQKFLLAFPNKQNRYVKQHIFRLRDDGKRFTNIFKAQTILHTQIEIGFVSFGKSNASKTRIRI